MLAGLEALTINAYFMKCSITESDIFNVNSWVSHLDEGRWKFQFYLNEIKSLSSSAQVGIKYVGRSANNAPNMLANWRVDGDDSLVAPIL